MPRPHGGLSTQALSRRAEGKQRAERPTRTRTENQAGADEKVSEILKKLQARWGVSSVWQVLVILWVFAVTGFSILYVKDPVYSLLGIGPQSAWWVRVLAFIFIAMPIYQVLLLCFGVLFGQGKFFWAFAKRVVGRFRFSRARVKQSV